MDRQLGKWGSHAGLPGVHRDEAVIHPEAYSYKGYNRYGLFYTSLAYTVLF